MDDTSLKFANPSGLSLIWGENKYIMLQYLLVYIRLLIDMLNKYSVNYPQSNVLETDYFRTYCF